MMEAKPLSAKRETANIYLSLYLCSGFDSVQDKTRLGDINSMVFLLLLWQERSKTLQSSILRLHLLRLQHF